MTTPDALRDAEYIADISDIPDETDGEALAPSHALRHGARRKEIRAKAKIALLDKLLRDLDVMIYSNLSALYYMDCSLIQFAIRALVQMLFFTPKSTPLPTTTRHQPYVGAMLGSNLFPILIHLISPNPEAGEAFRGYLHGGFFIDFVGQKGPVSKIWLVALDLVILIIQVVMLGALLEREKTKALITSSRSTSSSTAEPTQETANSQDHDSEERGVLRPQSPQRPRPEDGDIELDDLRPSQGDSNSSDESDERQELLAEPGEEDNGSGDIHPRDPFSRGDFVVLDMGIITTLRKQWRLDPRARGGTLSSSFSSSRDPAAYLRGRLGIEVDMGNRRLMSPV